MPAESTPLFKWSYFNIIVKPTLKLLNIVTNGGDYSTIKSMIIQHILPYSAINHITENTKPDIQKPMEKHLHRVAEYINLYQIITKPSLKLSPQ